MQEARLHYLVFDEVVGSSVSAVAASAHQTKSRTAASSTLYTHISSISLTIHPAQARITTVPYGFNRASPGFGTQPQNSESKLGQPTAVPYSRNRAMAVSNGKIERRWEATCHPEHPGPRMTPVYVYRGIVGMTRGTHSLDTPNIHACHGEKCLQDSRGPRRRACPLSRTIFSNL